MTLRTLFCVTAALFVLLPLSAVPAADPPDADRGTAAGLRAFHAGNGLLQRGHYDLAADEYERFLDAHPADENAPVARYGLAVCRFRTGRYADAASLLETLADDEEFKFAAEVLTMLGQCRLVADKPARAADLFRRVIEEHPKDKLASDARVQLAEALYKSGKYAEAARTCRELLERSPETRLRRRAAFFLGLCETARGHDEKAAELFESLLTENAADGLASRATLLAAQCLHRAGELNRAAGHYETCLRDKNRPDRPDALYGLGLLRLQAHRLSDAAGLLDEFLSVAGDHPQVGAARIARGRVHFERGDVAKAEALFAQAAGSDAEAAEAAYWSAKCMMRRKDYAGAAEKLSDAMEKFGDGRLAPEMAYDRAVALFRADQLKPAARATAGFLDRYDDHPLAPDALHLLALIEHRRGRYDESAEHCRRFEARFKDPEQASKVAFLSAENEFLAGRFDDAAPKFQQFLDHYPNDPQAHAARFRLGMALYTLERFDAAAPILAKVVDEGGEAQRDRPALLALGEIAFNRGEWKTAETLFRRYLSAKSSLAQVESPWRPDAADDALLKLAIALQRQERYSEALSALDRLLAEHGESPHRLQAIFERGQIMAATGRDQEAQKAFESVLADGPESRFAAHAMNQLASLAQKRSDYDAASKWFAKAAKTAPSDQEAAEAIYRRGANLLAAHQFDEAEQVFRSFLRKYERHDKAPLARAQWAVAAARQEQCTEALEISATIDAAALPPALGASLQYERAWCLRSLGRNEDAAAAYEALIDDESAGRTRLHAMLELAALRMQQDHADQAIALLRRLRDGAAEAGMPPNDRLLEQAGYRLAVCELETGAPESAAKTFAEFLDRFPDSELVASAAAQCGEALFKLGRHGEAARYLDRVVREFPDDPANGPALLRLGESLAALQKWARSEEAFEQYLDRYADGEAWYQAAFGVGFARENQARHDDAIRAYRRVVEKHKGPTAARAQFQIGECLFAKKQYEEAARELLKVDILYAYPEWSAAALFEAGRCFEKLGKLVEARTQFQQAAEKHAESNWGRLAAQRLNQISVAGLPGR